MNLLNLEDEKFKNVEVRGNKFKIRFMSPLDKIKIAQHRCLLQGGNPVDALTQDDFIFMENVSIVNVCTEEMPKGFNQNESCVNWDDGELINELALEIRNHTNDIESKLKKNRPVE